MKSTSIRDLSVRAVIRGALLLGMSLLVAVGVLTPAASAQAAAPAVTGQSLRPVLPPPTGHLRVGVVPLHLVDRTRPDPWVPEQSIRELMVSVWYPARRVQDYPLAPWLPPAAWTHFTQEQGAAPDVLQVPLTHGAVGAPVDPQRGGRPVARLTRLRR